MQLKQATSFNFAAQGPQSAAVLPGWEPAEAGVRWPQGRSSRMILPRPEGADELLLLLEVTPRLAPPLLTRQTLRIKVNGVTQRLAYLSRLTAVAVPVPAALAAQNPALELQFEHPDEVRPDLISASAERRGSSVGFLNATIFTCKPQTLPRLPAPPPLSLPPVEELSDEALAGYFASIGDNCEFGLTQRRTGAEPMDLLRFAGLDLPGLALGLGEAFSEIIAPGAIDLELHPFTPRGEYVTVARRYNFRAHTGQFEGDIELPRLYVRELKKLIVTQRLFASDLASGQRILVFKHNDLTERADITPLLRAVAQHGPATLLHVLRDGSGRRHGMVEQAGPFHLRGYIDRFNPYDNAIRPASAHWATICRNAYRMWRAARLAAAGQDALQEDVA